MIELDYRVIIAFVVILILLIFAIVVVIILDANSQTNKMNNQSEFLSVSQPTDSLEAKDKCLNDSKCLEVSIIDKFGTESKLWKINSDDKYVFLSKYKWEFTQNFSRQQDGTVRIEKGKIYKLDFIPKRVFGTFKSGLYSQHEITKKNINSILSVNNEKNVYRHFSNFELNWKNLDYIWVIYE